MEEQVQKASSPNIISKNIALEMNNSKPKKAAVAIALAMAKQKKK
jgi:hypothetical protein